jgi:hypothetical protein
MTRIDLDRLRSKFETGDRPDGNDFQDLIDTVVAQATDLGTSGNNEAEVSGIENSTVIDSVPLTDWRMIKYIVSISKNTGGTNKFYATEFSILIDNEDASVTEYGSIDNDGDMGTITVTATNGNLVLTVSPNPAIVPITARFARMGLKA